MRHIEVVQETWPMATSLMTGCLQGVCIASDRALITGTTKDTHKKSNEAWQEEKFCIKL